MKKVLLAFLLLGLNACSSDDDSKSAGDYQVQVTTGMHQKLLSEVKALHAAAVDLQAAAPQTTDRGWSASEDGKAIESMTQAWLRARSAYERTEGALAPLFPDIDAAIDARYEDFLEALGAEGDTDLFDDQGVTGMHAIERILFANDMPGSVITVEETLPGYVPATWPETAEEAAEFKEKLAAQLVKDTARLESQWTPQRIDLAGAFGGLISLMNEQREKVNKAASEEEESRYAQRTMADIRDNLAGTRAIYQLFSAWVKSKDGGAALDAEVEDAFDQLEEIYATVDGDAFPAPPATWSSEDPSPADLDTPFGKLFTTVHDAVDPNKPGSAVDAMNRVATLLGFPEYQEE
ncbi:MAG TPA: EfeM/EfeO family lipoprotein [Polyangiaceae bacterium]|nr:EfeM/EfeO family lipoprotein [Polyangiaceae bacterium]